MWRVVVCYQETSKNEDAKARYRAVKNTTKMSFNDRKRNKQQQLLIQLLSLRLSFLWDLTQGRFVVNDVSVKPISPNFKSQA